jgi:hypothetical protein
VRPATRYAIHASTTIVTVSATTSSVRSARSSVSGALAIQRTGTRRNASRGWNPLVRTCPLAVGPFPVASDRAMVSV